MYICTHTINYIHMHWYAYIYAHTHIHTHTHLPQGQPHDEQFDVQRSRVHQRKIHDAKLPTSRFPPHLRHGSVYVGGGGGGAGATGDWFEMCACVCVCVCLCFVGVVWASWSRLTICRECCNTTDQWVMTKPLERVVSLSLTHTVTHTHTWRHRHTQTHDTCWDSDGTWPTTKPLECVVSVRWHCAVFGNEHVTIHWYVTWLVEMWHESSICGMPCRV